MLSIVVTLLVGSIFGLALAAPPGPMNAIIAEESVIHGWLAGFKAGLGAMSADAIFFVLAALGVVTFLQGSPTLHAVMMGVGGVLLLYFATVPYRTHSPRSNPTTRLTDQTIRVSNQTIRLISQIIRVSDRQGPGSRRRSCSRSRTPTRFCSGSPSV